MDSPDEFTLHRTGFAKLDEAPRKAPRSPLGTYLLKDPTYDNPDFSRVDYFPRSNQQLQLFDRIDKAYDIDSLAKAGVDKYVELCVKPGWHLDCETPEPVRYLLRRFQLMEIMTDKEWSRLITETVQDYVKYSNALWVKKRMKPPVEVTDLPQKGAMGQALPVLGYFRVDPKRMKPVYSKSGRQLIGWEFTPEGGQGKTKRFARADVVHFAFNVQAGKIWGSPSLGPVLDDIRAFRQCEEYIIKLLYKHLNPYFHHKVPDNAQDGFGRQEDVDAAYAAHSVIAPDGMIITPPGHEITVIGAESHALRGEGYIQILRQRIYAGLGVNQLVMGESDGSSVGSADAMTVTMHNRAKLIQQSLAEALTMRVVYELLLEGGFDPLNSDDMTRWVFDEIETETKIKLENHVNQLYMNHLVTETEARRAMGRKPVQDEQRGEMYLNRVAIPLEQAKAEAKIDAALASPAPTGSAAQSASRNNPSNQHGSRGAPKVRPK